MQRKGFTLVEMLVVIVIISLLMAMILPALAAARASARTTLDASNLKQITFAWLRFQEANKDAMMPWMTWDVTNEPNYPRYWFGGVNNSTSPGTVVFKDGFLAPFLETDQRAFQDPDFSRALKFRWRGSRGYDVNHEAV